MAIAQISSREKSWTLAATLVRALTAVTVAVATLVATAESSGQCPDWRVRGSGLRLNGTVYDSVLWDPDLGGPRAPMLVVAGNFTRAGGPDGIAARNIAAWDGTNWHAFGSGIGDDYQEVYSLGVYNAELYAGGNFLTAGGAPANGIARWSGVAWNPVGDGVAGGEAPSVRALTVYDGHLIAGGLFTSAGGQPASSIARWNGSFWQPVGSGMQGTIQGFPTAVTSLLRFNDALFAGGAFTGAGGQSANCIARWDGSSWHNLGSGMQGGEFTIVTSLRIFSGQVIAGGEFTVAGGQSASCIASWNGNTWQGLGGGLGGPSEPFVSDLAIYNGELVASGVFTTAGGSSAYNIARWNGAFWQPLGSGVGRGCNSLTVFNNELFAGGWFRYAGDHLVHSLARWNGAQWSDMLGVLRPSGGFGVRTITPWAGSVVLGGHYATTDTNLAVLSHNLTAWDGRTLRPLGTPDSIVLASAVAPGNDDSTDLVIGGQFTAIDSVPFGHIARLNEAPGMPWEPMGAGFNAYVVAITRFNGSTYASGLFTASGATPMNYIARWDGAAWQPVGPGPITGLNSWTYCMKGYATGPSNLSLVVGGIFTSAGGVGANRIASFNVNTATQETSWTAMGDGFDAPVRAIEYFNGSIYAAGDFTASGSTPISYIARWNGSAWEPVGGGMNSSVRAMTVSNGTLIVGGYFTTAGGRTVDRLARWDGKEWTRVGGGVNHVVFALSTFGNELHVGGEFTRARLNVLESPLWARFSEDGIPWFAEQPVPQIADCGANASFHIGPALGYGGLVYQWRKDGVTLTNGPTGSGSTIVSNGLNLHILDVNESDAGDYDCVLSNACGGTPSLPATLTVVGDCPPSCSADFNADGAVNSQDFFDFLTAFFAAAPSADFNHDTLINSQDFFDFLAAFFAGC